MNERVEVDVALLERVLRIAELNLWVAHGELCEKDDEIDDVNDASHICYSDDAALAELAAQAGLDAGEDE